MSLDGYELGADELTFQRRLAILKEHCQHLLKVAMEFVHRGALRVSTWKSRHVADKQASFRVTFDNRGVGSHHIILAHTGVLVAAVSGVWHSRAATIDR